ncbi:DUF4179 domain-containing protein [Sporanaerobacter acetigenes]|uniref:DUF4179 domain-containing protein n=1 Tax=Sporanaerobacter acetigenes TaxID=165813 RepID=UPI0010454E7A|nr:DUF4179 domain-containing protein [Sporanaerobacter acetigenes]
MKFDHDETIIKNALDTIETPEYDIVSNVERKIRKQKTPMKFKRSVSVAIVCICLMVSVGVMAVTIPSFNKLLSIVSPDIALMLQPIEASCEDNGIKMEVLGAMNDDEMAVIYITMKDLVGDRIDETLDIYDYNLTGTNISNCQIVHYDETTKTATLRMRANGGKKLNGKKASFQVESFLVDKLTFDGVETGIDLLDINEVEDSQTISLDMNNDVLGGGGELFEEFETQGIIGILKPDQMKITLPEIDFMYISNIGYIDGRLHIQTKWVGDGIDDHGYFYFVDALGNRIDKNPDSIYFGVDDLGNTKWGRNYIEYIFDVDDINLHDLKLMGYFVSHGNYVTGNWKTTFKLKSVGEEKKIDCNIKMDTLNVNTIKVSPLGITLVCNGEIDESTRIPISINMTDGSSQTFDCGISYSDNGEVRIKYIPSLPLDVSKVESVNINGTVIDIN